VRADVVSNVKPRKLVRWYRMGQTFET